MCGEEESVDRGQCRPAEGCRVKRGRDGVEKCRQTNIVSGRRVECVFSVANH